MAVRGVGVAVRGVGGGNINQFFTFLKSFLFLNISVFGALPKLADGGLHINIDTVIYANTYVYTTYST